MTSLPPLPALLAFETVARTLSFTRAAEELGVTQGAISHRIRLLERHYGRRLLERLNPGVRLTEAGLAMRPGVQDLLLSLRRLDRLALTPRNPRQLRIGVGTALGAGWLAGRMHRLLAAMPEIEFELVTIDTERQAAAPDLDLRLLWVRQDQAHATPLQRPLVREWIFPVCHPRLLDGRRPPLSVEHLLSLPLLHKGLHDPAHQGPEWNWSTWAERAGLPAPLPGRKRPQDLRFRELGAALAAAGEGAGVALARSLLVADAIAEGRLVRPLGPRARMASSRVQIARWSPDLTGNSAVRRIVTWIRQDMQATVARL